MFPSNPRLRRLACGLLAASATAGVAAAPKPTGVCPTRPGTPVTQIDVFDGDPALQAYLAPDDDQDGARTYTVKGLYVAHRSVTVRCQYGDEQVDVKLAKPVKACQYTDKPEPQLSCK